MGAVIDYTPATWVSEYCGKDRIAIFKVSDKRRIATIVVKTPKMDEANAHLIAAAPELLDMIKELIKPEVQECVTAWGQAVIDAEQLITRAEQV